MFDTKNLTFIINVLLDIDYSLNFIFDTIKQRIKKLLKNKHLVRKDMIDNICTNESASWLTVFIPFHTKKFKRFDTNDSRVSFHCPNKIVNYIKKDIFPCTSKSNVVYYISYNNYDASYVR